MSVNMPILLNVSECALNSVDQRGMYQLGKIKEKSEKSVFWNNASLEIKKLEGTEYRVVHYCLKSGNCHSRRASQSIIAIAQAVLYSK